MEPMTAEETIQMNKRVQHTLAFHKFMQDSIASGAIGLDLNGHFCRPSSEFDRASKDYVKNRFGFLMDDSLSSWLTDSQKDQIQKAIETGTVLDEFLVFKDRFYGCCNECGSPFGMRTNGKILQLFPECLLPNGLQPYKVRIPFPSGKMVVANNLRYCFPEAPSSYEPGVSFEENRKWDINTDFGCKTVTEFHAKNGLLFFSVMNTSPNVYKQGKDGIVVSRSVYNEDATDEEDEEIHVEGKKVAEVCTDLWWVSIADYDLVMKNLPNKRGEGDPLNLHELRKDPKALAKKLDWTVVSVTRGEYEFEIFPNAPTVFNDAPSIYADGRLVKKQGKK